MAYYRVKKITQKYWDSLSPWEQSCRLSPYHYTPVGTVVETDFNDPEGYWMEYKLPEGYGQQLPEYTDPNNIDNWAK